MWIINLIDNVPKYGDVALNLANSLREKSDLPVSFLVTDRTDTRRLMDFRLHKVNPIEVQLPSPTTKLHDIELTKLRVFSLFELDWFACLDADLILTGDNPDKLIEESAFGWKFSAISGGQQSPLCSACFIGQPDHDYWMEILELIVNPQFNFETGYRGYGPIYHNREVWNWSWHGANCSQGMLWKIWGQRLRWADETFNSQFKHIGMDKEQSRQMNCPKCQKFVKVNVVDIDKCRKFTCTNCWHVWGKTMQAKGQVTIGRH